MHAIRTSVEQEVVKEIMASPKGMRNDVKTEIRTTAHCTVYSLHLHAYTSAHCLDWKEYSNLNFSKNRTECVLSNKNRKIERSTKCVCWMMKCEQWRRWNAPLRTMERDGTMHTNSSVLRKCKQILVQLLMKSMWIYLDFDTNGVFRVYTGFYVSVCASEATTMSLSAHYKMHE